jgi:uncharacterized protein
MKISFHSEKRNETLQSRGLDFADVTEVFEGMVFEFFDLRFDYGEGRIITVGYLEGRMVVIGWTQRGDTRHIFTMRKANKREQIRYKDRLD